MPGNYHCVLTPLLCCSPGISCCLCLRQAIGLDGLVSTSMAVLMFGCQEINFSTSSLSEIMPFLSYKDLGRVFWEFVNSRLF